MIVRLILAVTFVFGCLGEFAPVDAQSADAPVADAAEQSLAIEPMHILRRANSDELFIQSLIRNSARFDARRELASELDDISKSVKFAAEQQASLDITSLTVRRLEGIERQWKFYENQLAQWRVKMRRSASPIADDTAALSKLRVEWAATIDADVASPALLGRANEIVREIADGDAVLAKPLAEMIALGRRGNDADADLHEWLRLVRQELSARDLGLLSLDSPPIWELRAVFDSDRLARTGLTGSLALERSFARDFDAANKILYYFLAAFALLLLAAMVWLSRSAQAPDATGEVRQKGIISRPIWAWLVLLIFVAMIVGYNGPVIRLQILLLAGWVPILLMLPERLMARLGRAPHYGAFFYFVSLCASLALSQFLGYRIALVIICTAMLAVFYALFKRPGYAEDVKLDRIVDIWCVFSVAALSLAIFANLIGNMTLATAMTDGVLNSSYAGLAICAGAVVLMKISNNVETGLASTRFSYLSDKMAQLVPALISPGRIALMILWAYIILSSFRLYRPITEWLGTLADNKIEMGEFSLSLGSIVTFTVAIWATAAISRTIRKLLADTIFPSFSFSHGAGASIAALVYYGLILAGFLVALSLAGFDVSKLTIILGALGVGVGFGLQGSVGNFINGIIMLIERPIRLGDIVNFDGTVGVVQNIGMRATTLRSPQGAEIVIPNAALLAGKITNWSPFGSPRQIEVDIAVELGNDQTLVQRLILDTASHIKGIAPNPSPVLLFHGYSPGTMNFAIRMWTLRGTDWELARSHYITALDLAFADAGMNLAISRASVQLNLTGAKMAGDQPARSG